ncbi:kinase-like protein [Bipolaris maydis]|nr:kinase-like protein [Bipolaris maydis]
MLMQQKFKELEQPIRDLIPLQEKVAGTFHRHTIARRRWLALVLFTNKIAKNQKRGGGESDEVGQLLQELVRPQEKALGTQDTMTLWEREWYAEAERILKQVIQQRKGVENADCDDNLASKHMLAVTLYMHGLHAEAERMLQKVVQQRELLLGLGHEDTIESKRWLAAMRDRRVKPTERRHLSSQSVQGPQKVLTIHYEKLMMIQDTQLANRSRDKEPLSTKVPAEAPAASTKSLVDVINNRQTAYEGSEIQQVLLLLSQVVAAEPWRKVPRIYIVLRTINCLDFLDIKRSQFVATQDLVMTKSMDLEKGEEGQHCFFREHKSLPLEMKGVLGSGGFGRVDRVLSLISFQEYALKRVPRSAAFSGRKTEAIKQFIAKIKASKRIKHHHVVDFVGSYTDPKHMGLIMSPVADIDLSAYLATFLHKNNISHKDIKPNNVLVYNGNVLFTDFGLAYDSPNQEGSTTASMVNGMTPRYYSPEVANYEPRNTSSDIWSRAINSIYTFLKEHGTSQAFIRTNPTGTDALIIELKGIGSPADNVALVWTQDMIMVQQQLRPTATSLVASILSKSQEESGSEVFCEICCTSQQDDLSDFNELDIADM